MPLSRRRPRNIGLLFDWNAERSVRAMLHLDRPFDIAPEIDTSFDSAALAGVVTDVSSWLHAAGLRHGDRLAIVKDNHLDFAMIAAGAARIGALPVMISPLNSIENIRIMIDKIRPAVLVAGNSVLARAAADGTTLAESGVPVVALGAPIEESPAGTLLLDDLRGGAAAPVRPAADDEPMIVTHTSGTTGVPKLVVHSANTAIHSVPPRLERSRLPFLTTRRGDVVATCFSYAHIRALCWVASQLIVAPRSMVAISDPSLDNVARMLAAHPPTYLEALPNVFQYWEELTDTRPELFAQIRLYISTFDAVHPRTVRKFLSASGRRFPVWGWSLAQTEIASMVANLVTRRAVSRPQRPRRDVTSVGRPSMVRARVVDAKSGRKQAVGEPGLLMISSKSRCLTYLGEDDRYQAKVNGKWWNSGDLAERVGFGRFRMIDREVDMIPGTSCIELEGTLLDRLDGASEVIVLAMPDGPPVPVVCMRDDQLDPTAWKEAVQGLPELDEPRLVPWDDMPRTGTWKVRRTELRRKLFGATTGIGTGAWT